MNNWDDLRFFLALAREGSLSRASRLLGVNHSTVSRRIQNLEELYNVSLFNQSMNGYTLNDAGRAIYDLALDLEQRTFAVERRLQANDKNLDGLIRLTLPEVIFNHGMSASLFKFKQQNPGVEFEVHVTPRVLDLKSRETDIAVRFSDRIPNENLIASKISQPRFGIYCRKDFTFTNKLPIIAWNKEFVTPSWARQISQNAEISLKVNSVTSAFSAVKAGFGIALLPCIFVQFVDDPDIKLFSDITEKLDWCLWVLLHPDLRSNERIRTCYQYIVKEMKKAAVDHGDLDE